MLLTCPVHIAFGLAEKERPEYWHAFIEEGVEMGKMIEMRISQALDFHKQTPSTTFSTLR